MGQVCGAYIYSLHIVTDYYTHCCSSIEILPGGLINLGGMRHMRVNNNDEKINHQPIHWKVFF